MGTPVRPNCFYLSFLLLACFHHVYCCLPPITCPWVSLYRQKHLVILSSCETLNFGCFPFTRGKRSIHANGTKKSQTEIPDEILRVPFTRTFCVFFLCNDVQGLAIVAKTRGRSGKQMVTTFSGWKYDCLSKRLLYFRYYPIGQGKIVLPFLFLQ